MVISLSAKGSGFKDVDGVGENIEISFWGAIAADSLDFIARCRLDEGSIGAELGRNGEGDVGVAGMFPGVRGVIGAENGCCCCYENKDKTCTTRRSR